MSRKKTILKPLRDAVWDYYAGELSGTVDCFACGKMLKRTDYECGHVMSESNGGELIIDNLRPIHGTCNKSMGPRNLIDFRNEMIKAGVFKVNAKLNLEKTSLHILYNQQNTPMADKKKEIQLPAALEFIKELTVDELKEWCEVYGTKKGKSKAELIGNITSSPGFNSDQLLRMIPSKKKLMTFKVTTLSKICEQLSETKKGTKRELVIRILRKNPNIDVSKYADSLEDNSNESQEEISVTSEDDFKKMINEAVKLSLIESNKASQVPISVQHKSSSEGKAPEQQEGEEPGTKKNCECLCNNCTIRIKSLEESITRLNLQVDMIRKLVKI